MIVPVKELLGEECLIKILAYPTMNIEYAEEIVRELEALNVSQVEFTGTTKINSVKILGKGTTSIVLKAFRDSELVAVKILRTDADRRSLISEANMLKIANKVGIGPKLIGVGNRALIMEYVEGEPVIEFLRKAVNSGKYSEIIEVIRKSLIQAFKLDQVGLSHGELSYADKHIRVAKDGRVTIIDFESSSTSRKSPNLTAVLQYFLIRNPYSHKIREILGVEEISKLFSLLRKYKETRAGEDVEKIMLSLHLTNTEIR